MSKQVYVGREEVERKVIEIIRRKGVPVSIDCIAYNLGVGWGTARSILFEMALKGKVKAIKTTKSWIFTLPNQRKEASNDG